MQRPLQLPVLPRISLPCVFALIGAVTSCSDDERPVIVVNENPAAIPPSVDDACKDEEDGAPCADGRLCVAGRCVLSTCGDGVLAEGEACDDGNAAAGDGCSPACNLEYTLCPEGTYVLAGSECPGGGAEAPPPVDPGTEEACSGRVEIGSAEGTGGYVDPITKAAFQGESGDTVRIAFVMSRGRKPAPDGQFIWRSTLGDPDLPNITWTYDHFASLSAASNTFTCPDSPGTHSLLVWRDAPGCPRQVFTFVVVCTGVSRSGAIDAGAGDAGTQDGGVRDAGSSADSGRAASGRDV
jgi:cysteine-rich repeat protein